MRLKYKPLSFSTTLRNPERMGEILVIMKNFDNKIMSEDLCNDIYVKFIETKTVFPQKAIRENGWKEKYEKFSFTDEELGKILSDYDNSHKEAGFPAGTASRVDTYLRLIKEFGLIYYEFDKVIKLTKSGLEYAQAFEDNDIFKMQKIFMNALINFQTNSPLRANKSENRPVSLLFNVINLLGEKVGTFYIKKNELPLLICSKDNNYERIVEIIIEYRKCLDEEQKKELIYTYILSDYEETETYVKYSRVFIEAVDDYIRKFRFAGLIDLKGIDLICINKMLDPIKENIMNLNDVFINEADPRKFIMQISEYNDFLETIFKEIPSDNNITSNDWIDRFEKEEINIDEEILKLTKTRSTKNLPHELLTLAHSLLLEFLFVLKLQKEFPDLTIKGNYKSNEEGIPIFHAPGGYPDIIIESDTNVNAIVEVTLLGGRNQLAQELLPISRHLSDYKKGNENAFCWYISRVIHEDVERYSRFIKNDENLDIYLSNIPLSITQINNANNSYKTLINNLSN